MLSNPTANPPRTSQCNRVLYYILLCNWVQSENRYQTSSFTTRAFLGLQDYILLNYLSYYDLLPKNKLKSLAMLFNSLHSAVQSCWTQCFVCVLGIVFAADALSALTSHPVLRFRTAGHITILSSHTAFKTHLLSLRLGISS